MVPVHAVQLLQAELDPAAFAVLLLTLLRSSAQLRHHVVGHPAAGAAAAVLQGTRFKAEAFDAVPETEMKTGSTSGSSWAHPENRGGTSQLGLAGIWTPQTGPAVWTLVALVTLAAAALAPASAGAHGGVGGLTFLDGLLALAGRALVAVSAFTHATVAFAVSYGRAETGVGQPGFDHDPGLKRTVGPSLRHRCSISVTSTQLVLELLAVLVVTLAVGAVVTAVAVTPAAHTLPSALTLHAAVPLALGSEVLLVLIADGALAELPDKTVLAAVDPGKRSR